MIINTMITTYNTIVTVRTSEILGKESRRKNNGLSVKSTYGNGLVIRV